MAKEIEGYDYDLHVVVKLSRAQWQEQLARVKKEGGRRRCEGGETFAHKSNGRLAFEVYARIPEKETDDDDEHE